MKITRVSSLTGIERTLEIPCTPDQLDAYKRGTLIQNAMPGVPAHLREFVMTGIVQEEWDEFVADIREKG